MHYLLFFIPQLQVFNMINILDRIRENKATILAFFISLIWFIFIGNKRLIAKDEGFYLMAIESVLNGKNVYYDFFYPQMPLLPYLYALFFTFIDLTFESARTVSALIPTLIGTIIYSYSFKISNSKTISFLFLTAFLITNFTIAWFAVVQTYSISTLFLLASCICLCKINKKNIILASFFFSLAVGCRLFFAGLFPLILLYIFINSQRKEKLKNCYSFSIFGLLTGLLICSYFFIDFDKFYLNNLGYHLNRTSKGFTESLNNKLVVAKVILGLKPTVKFDAYHMQVLFYSSVVSVIYLLISKQQTKITTYIIIGLIVLSLIPNPTYVQYFSTLVPFMFLICIDCFCYLKQKNTKLIYLIGSLFFLSFLPYSYTDFDRYTKSGKGVIGISNQNNAKHWNLSNLKKIASIINENCKKKKCSAISTWPGYLIGTKTQIVSGYENHFADVLARTMNEEDKENYKLRGTKDVLQIAENKKPDFIILNGKTGKKKKKKLEEIGYKVLYKTRLIRVFKVIS